MPPYIPNAVYWIVGIIAVIVAIYFASEYLDAATAMLPGGEGGGER